MSIKQKDYRGYIIFSGEINWKKSIFIYLVITGAWAWMLSLPITLEDFKLDYNYLFGLGVGILGTFLIIIIDNIIQPLRITERGIYPPTRGIVNIFLMRERFIPFSVIKEFRIYNPSLEKFPDYWARMSKREKEAKDVLESEYDIVLKNGKVIKMNSWTTALYLSKNLPSVKKWKEFRDILIKINEELKKGKTVIRKEDIIGKG